MLAEQGKQMPKKSGNRYTAGSGGGTPKEVAALTSSSGTAGSSSSTSRNVEKVEKVEKVAPLKIRLSTRKKRKNDDSEEESGFLNGRLK
jgi:hypothetical protein